MPTSLIVQTSFLGDVVLTTPLAVRLAREGPVDIVCTPAGAALLANHPALRDVIAYDKRGADRGFAGFWRLAETLRERKYDAAYLAQGSARSGALALAARIKTRVGFATSAGRWFYDIRVPYRYDAHHAERLLSLADPQRTWTPAFAGVTGVAAGVTRDAAGVTGDAAGGTGDAAGVTGDAAGVTGPSLPSLVPGTREREAVDALLASAGAADEPLVGLAPGSIWGTKRWPGYPALAAALRPLGRLVVVGSADDIGLANEIMAAAPDTIVAAGRLSLLASAQLISRLRVLVTNDSAPQHLASAMRTPTVAIFGPTIPGFGFGPLAPKHTIVEMQGLTCRPCDIHGPKTCPLGHWRCMREITPDRVAAVVRDLLDVE